MPYDPDKHHRRSVRLAGYDYSQAGAYFVTIVAHGRECLFGDVVGAEMRVNEYGQIVAHTWRWLALQYPQVILDEWVVMPNHLHGVIVIVETDDDMHRRGGSRTAQNPQTRTEGGSRTAPTRKPLGRLIGAFKTVSTKHVNSLRGTPGWPVWQRNYHDRIIRDDDELNHTREYIAINPARWAEDEENPNGAKQ